MVSKITFLATASREALIVRNITAVEIASSWKQLTDTATITLPRKVLYLENGVKKLTPKTIKETFKIGDKVTIELGYNGVYNTEFIGYISHVSADIPVVIKLEDELFVLKRLPVNVSMASSSLPNLLATILPNYDIDALDIELGAVRFSKTTVAKVLEYLQEEYSLFSYMSGTQLVCGKIYADDSDILAVALHLEQNVVNADLNYKQKEDVLIRINAISTLPNGTKIEVTVGDENGVEKQLSYFGIELEATLESIAKEDLKKYKVDGFSGAVNAYGLPFVQHGGKVQLTSDLYADRNGEYYVEATNLSFNDGGFRRKIQLGEKTSA